MNPAKMVFVDPHGVLADLTPMGFSAVDVTIYMSSKTDRKGNHPFVVMPNQNDGVVWEHPDWPH